MNPNYVMVHSVHWGFNPPQKHLPPIFCQAPLNWQTVQAPLSKQTPLYIGFS